ncbi:RluA family pseudouridine synthase [soil metagenome]
MNERIYFQVSEDSHRQRLDEFLFNKFHSLSKIYLRERLKEGDCEINGLPGNAGIIIKSNDFIEIEVDLRRETAMKPEPIPLEIVYEEATFLVVNKPPGMLVHPTHRDKNGTLLNALSYYLNFRFSDSQSKIIRPGLIHRLDKQTSGLIVISKNVRTHQILSKKFQKRLVEKKYLALVGGILKEDSGEILAPIGRFEELKHWSVKDDGKPSHTRFRVIERFADKTLLELEPVTGRTNQLRIHCEFIGHPIVGDINRGGREFRRLCLHAYKLAFQHPHDKHQLAFDAKMPIDMQI